MHPRLLFVSALSCVACLPSFEDAECYADVDCPGGLVCGDMNRCVNETIVPRDAGTTDAAVDTPDAAAPVDGGTEDAGMASDAGPGADAGFDVRVAPPSIDFGVQAIGCPPDTRRVTLTNGLMGTVRIDDVVFTAGTSNEFSMAPLMTPFDLGAAPRTIDVSYAATNAGMDQGALQIIYAGQRLDVNLAAEGQMNPQLVETITSSAGPIDILMVVDSSANMSALQQRLSDRVVFLLLDLEFELWDYRIAVTTMDVSATGPAGRFLGVPPIITQQLSNRQTLLENRLQVGQTGAEEERAFDAVQLALSSPLIDTDNAGFLRPNAALLVMYFAADEEDSSVTVTSHIQFLAALKAATNAPVAVNTIVPVPTFCSLKGGASGARGQRFIDATQQTSGTTSDICGNSWDPALTTFPPVAPPRRFTLTRPAVAGTISVRVEGVLQPSDGSVWTYDAATQAIVFEATSTPNLGDDVEVTYRPAC